MLNPPRSLMRKPNSSTNNSKVRLLNEGAPLLWI
jgi:hypothetical protein